VTKAVPADQLESVVMKQVKKLANGPTQTYARIKDMINRASFNRLSEGLATEVELQYLCGKTNDFRECVTAFFEKRAPQCKGN
jgi:2-(1,2-epoxy-1,2-dihydrophenyl)acetyl-CoA isomerase